MRRKIKVAKKFSCGKCGGNELKQSTSALTCYCQSVLGVNENGIVLTGQKEHILTEEEEEIDGFFCAGCGELVLDSEGKIVNNHQQLMTVLV